MVVVRRGELTDAQWELIQPLLVLNDLDAAAIAIH